MKSKIAGAAFGDMQTLSAAKFVVDSSARACEAAVPRSDVPVKDLQYYVMLALMAR